MTFLPIDSKIRLGSVGLQLGLGLGFGILVSIIREVLTDNITARCTVPEVIVVIAMTAAQLFCVVLG